MVCLLKTNSVMCSIRKRISDFLLLMLVLEFIRDHPFFETENVN